LKQDRFEALSRVKNTLRVAPAAALPSDMQRGFEGKFLSKLSKIDRQEIEGFLSHLVTEKNFLEIIFNALLDGIVVLRPNLHVIYTNNAAIDLLLINSRRRIVGERITDLCPNQEFCDVIARFALQRKPVISTEIELSGTPPRVLAISVIPLAADRGHAEGSVVLIIHDMTEARQHEEQRRRADRVATLATLAAGLAHEIKNPLNSLQIHAQLLNRALKEKGRGRTKRLDTSRIEQSSEVILEEIERLGDVVNDFLSAVRPTRPMSSRGNINTIVERVAETVRPEAEDKKIELRVRLDHDVPNTEFDANQMTQAVLNLVKNAMEAVEETENPLIELSTSLVDKEYRVEVRDNGRGIPPEDLERIFQPYFTTKFTGTGLGLAIVSRIVEEHQGRLDLFSEPGRGTMFILRFPLDSRPVRLLGSAEPNLPQMF
jgi:two-component system, sporulation sensor kinase E